MRLNGYISFVFVMIETCCGTAIGETVYFVAPHADQPVEEFDSADPGKFAKSSSAPHDTYNRGTNKAANWLVTYQDVLVGNGEGWDNPVFGQARRDTLLAVLAYIDSVINAPLAPTIEIHWETSPTSGSGFLAYAGTFFTLSTGFTGGAAATHIQTGSDPAAGLPDIQGAVDFGYPWQSNHLLMPSAGQFDLFSVLLHEITHGLGFLSLISPTGISEISISNPGSYSILDAYMEKDDGGAVEVGATTDLYTPAANYVGTTADLVSGRVVATLPTASAIRGANIVLFAPNPFQYGSSLSHWDTATYPDAVMSHAIAPGLVQRTYLPFEEGALFDMGYTGVSGSSPIINFTLVDQSVVETDGTVLISVNLSPASVTGSVSVNYSTSDGTATAGEDYTATNGTLTWALGESGVKTFSVPILIDAPIETSETFDIDLTAVTGDGFLGAISTSTVTILDPANIHVLSVPFYLDNASNFINGVPPSDGTAAFVGVKNTTNVPVNLTITYTDSEGNDHTPASNTFVLSANSMVSWRPFADDPVEGNVGRFVPNTDGGPAWGSVLIEADGPVTGRLILIDGSQNSSSLMLLPSGSGTTKLSVPFYLDNASNFNNGNVPSDGTASFVGVKNMSDVPVTLTITYTDAEGFDHTPIFNTFVVSANSMVSWRPFADDPVEGVVGQLVPNTDGGPPWGSVLIEADGPITGRLITLDGRQDSTGLMLLPNE